MTREVGQTTISRWRETNSAADNNQNRVGGRQNLHKNDSKTQEKQEEYGIHYDNETSEASKRDLKQSGERGNHYQKYGARKN